MKPAAGSSPQAGSARAGRASASSAAPGSKSAGVTPQSSQLHAIASAVAAAPAVDADRVAETRQAIEQGRFTVNPNAVADRLIDAARELLRYRKP